MKVTPPGRWYVFKHCGRSNHLSKCAWNLNCHCGRKACSSTSPLYGNCHYGTSHGGIISLCSEPSIVPCLIIIPPPNFQKKSEILKISDNNPTPKFWVTACQFETLDRFAVPSSATELKIWKTIIETVTETILLSINNPMQFNHLESTLPLV